MYSLYIANKTFVDVEVDMWDQIPAHMYKWEKYEKEAEESPEQEELYEGMFQLFEDKNPICQMNDYRFQVSQEVDDRFPDDSNIVQPGNIMPGRQYTSSLWVIDIQEHWLSHNEMPNPYFAIMPYFGDDNHRGNPDASELLELNKVQRKQINQVDKYMGDPSYIEDVWDKFLYYDLTCLTKDNERVSVKIFAPEYNRRFYQQERALTWAYYKGERKLYIPGIYAKGRWYIAGNLKNPSNFVHSWIKNAFGADTKVYSGPYMLNGAYWKSWNSREFYMTDEDTEKLIKKINHNTRIYKSQLSSTKNSCKGVIT